MLQLTVLWACIAFLSFATERCTWMCGICTNATHGTNATNGTEEQSGTPEQEELAAAPALSQY